VRTWNPTSLLAVFRYPPTSYETQWSVTVYSIGQLATLFLATVWRQTDWLITLTMEVNFYETTQRSIPESSHFQHKLPSLESEHRTTHHSSKHSFFTEVLKKSMFISPCLPVPYIIDTRSVVSVIKHVEGRLGKRTHTAFSSLQQTPLWESNIRSPCQDYPPFVEPKGSLPCSQEPTWNCLELDGSSPHPHILVLPPS
jgi:hypothetical protein